MQAELLRTHNAFKSSECKVKHSVKGTLAGKERSEYHPHLGNVCHTALRVNPPEPIPIKVFDVSTGTKVPLILKSTDTVEQLKQMLKENMPLKEQNLELIYNDEIVGGSQTLAELQVKGDACFLPIYRCTGG